MMRLRGGEGEVVASTQKSTTGPEFTIGIEEEYHLIDLETRDLVRDPPKELMVRCEARLGGRVTGEFLRSQIEIGTSVCKTVGEARAELVELRQGLAETGAEFGLAPMAASTHPFAHWQEQDYTDKERSRELAQDFQAVARRLLICGMHVHVGIADDELRIDILNQASYFLPHLLALSTSSPFWQGADTGLKCYRLSVFDALPRTGLPETYDSFSAYQRMVDLLIDAGLIEDSSKIWWDLRPHGTFPTLEMRITDVCTDVDDAAAVAALFVCLCRMLYRLRRQNQRWRMYPTFLLNENRWRAQRYGVGGSLIDFGRGELVAFGDLVDEMTVLVGEDAAALGCEREVAHARQIASRGTSADRQRVAFEAACEAGREPQEALCDVVDMLVAETVRVGDAGS